MLAKGSARESFQFTVVSPVLQRGARIINRDQVEEIPMHSPFTVVIRIRGYTREVSTPGARSVRIRGVKVPGQDDKQHDHQRNCGQS